VDNPGAIKRSLARAAGAVANEAQRGTTGERQLKKNKFLIEALLFVSYVLFAMCWVTGSAFIPNIMKALDIHDLAAGSNITNAVSAAKIVGTFVAAGILARLQVKWSVTLAMALMATSVFTPFVTSYPLLLLIRFLMGLGGALIIVYFAPIVMHWFPEKERPFVNGLNSVAFNVGTAIVVFFLGDLMHLFGTWQSTLVWISMGSLICLVLWLLFGSDAAAHPARGAVQGTRYSMREGLKEGFNWVYALSYAGILSFYVVLFTFYKNAGINQAKFVILAGIAGTIVGIMIARRTVKRLPVIRISGILQIVGIIGLHAKVWGFTQSDDVVALFSVVAGFFVFLPMTSFVTLAQEQRGMTPEKISVTFSLFWSISYLIATFVPFIFAHLVDINGGSYTVAFAFITVVSSSFLIGSFFLPESARALAPQGASQAA
jgi:MFS transporter, CP family, cyanate transporter